MLFYDSSGCVAVLCKWSFRRFTVSLYRTLCTSKMIYCCSNNGERNNCHQWVLRTAFRSLVEIFLFYLFFFFNNFCLCVSHLDLIKCNTHQCGPVLLAALERGPDLSLPWDFTRGRRAPSERDAIKNFFLVRGKTKRLASLFPPSEGWTLIPSVAVIGKAEARAGSAASVWRLPDDGLGCEQTLAEQLAVKWPLIELQTCLLWRDLLCKPLLDGGTLARVCVCVRAGVGWGGACWKWAYV